MNQTNTSIPSYLVYAGLLVSALSHFGWIISQNDAVTIVAGIVTLVGSIWAHYTVKAVVAAARLGGTSNYR